MKIAILADALDYQYAGIYYYTKELINALSKIDKKNQYLIVRSISEGDISPNVKELIVPTLSFPGAAPFRLFVTIPKVLTKEGVDIVIEPRHFGPFNLPKKIKRVTVIHDLSPLRFPEWHQFISRKLQQLFLPSILKRADHIVANSKFTAQDIIDYFPFTANKVSGILLGKEDFFHPQSNLTVLEKYNLSTPYLLHTGTIEPRKNLGLLVKAFEQIKQNQASDLQLVLVGKLGWKNESLVQLVKHSPFQEDIKLIGYVDRSEVPTLYTNATLFTYPSHFEGFGLPVLEAMSCGTPTLVSAVSSLPEIIGDAGLTFQPNNLIDFVKKITQLLDDDELRRSLSKRALVQAGKFNWEKTAKETLAVFEELMS